MSYRCAAVERGRRRCLSESRTIARVTLRVGFANGGGETAPRGSQRVSHVRRRCGVEHAAPERNTPWRGGSFSRKRALRKYRHGLHITLYRDR